MAKTVTKKEKFDYPYKSRFGTHKDMVVEGSEKDGFVTVKDEYGEYKTEVSNVDSGLVDWNRSSGKRLAGKLL